MGTGGRRSPSRGPPASAARGPPSASLGPAARPAPWQRGGTTERRAQSGPAATPPWCRPAGRAALRAASAACRAATRSAADGITRSTRLERSRNGAPSSRKQPPTAANSRAVPQSHTGVSRRLLPAATARPQRESRPPPSSSCTAFQRRRSWHSSAGSSESSRGSPAGVQRSALCGERQRRPALCPQCRPRRRPGTHRPFSRSQPRSCSSLASPGAPNAASRLRRGEKSPQRCEGSAVSGSSSARCPRPAAAHLLRDALIRAQPQRQHLLQPAGTGVIGPGEARRASPARPPPVLTDPVGSALPADGFRVRSSAPPASTRQGAVSARVPRAGGRPLPTARSGRAPLQWHGPSRGCSAHTAPCAVSAASPRAYPAPRPRTARPASRRGCGCCGRPAGQRRGG